MFFLHKYKYDGKSEGPAFGRTGCDVGQLWDPGGVT